MVVEAFLTPNGGGQEDEATNETKSGWQRDATRTDDSVEDAKPKKYEHATHLLCCRRSRDMGTRPL
jgi:hypothetical protein